jgi:hypothetical protein
MKIQLGFFQIIFIIILDVINGFHVRSLPTKHLRARSSSFQMASTSVEGADLDANTTPQPNFSNLKAIPQHMPDEKIMRKTALLVSLWKNIAFPPEDPDETIDFVLKDYGLNRRDVKGFIEHFQTCKDCAGKYLLSYEFLIGFVTIDWYCFTTHMSLALVFSRATHIAFSYSIL